MTTAASFDNRLLDLSKWSLPAVERQSPIVEKLRAWTEAFQGVTLASLGLPAIRIVDFADCGHQILIQPGWQDSGPEHWQTKWEKKFGLTRIQQRDWETPTCEEWIETMAHYVNARPSPIIVAHSLGCIATVHALHRGLMKPTAVVLVAPADMDNNIHNVTATGFSSIPTGKLGCPSLVIASTNDKYMTGERSRHLAALWGSKFVLLPGHGHINAQSSLGEWKDGQRLVSRFMLKVSLDQHNS